MSTLHFAMQYGEGIVTQNSLNPDVCRNSESVSQVCDKIIWQFTLCIYN